MSTSATQGGHNKTIKSDAIYASLNTQQETAESLQIMQFAYLTKCTTTNDFERLKVLYIQF